VDFAEDGDAVGAEANGGAFADEGRRLSDGAAVGGRDVVDGLRGAIAEEEGVDVDGDDADKVAGKSDAGGECGRGEGCLGELAEGGEAPAQGLGGGRVFGGERGAVWKGDGEVGRDAGGVSAGGDGESVAVARIVPAAAVGVDDVEVAGVGGVEPGDGVDVADGTGELAGGEAVGAKGREVLQDVGPRAGNEERIDKKAVGIVERDGSGGQLIGRVAGVDEGDGVGQRAGRRA
jgi:hypothetical protein